MNNNKLFDIGLTLNQVQEAFRNALNPDSELNKEGVPADAKAVGDTLAKQSEAITSKANGIIDTATGEVIALTDSAEAPLSGLVVYGKSTQDGTPTPDAPVPIVSVGEDGVKKVCVYRKNLFLPMTLETKNEVTLSKQDDYYVLNGTPNASGNFIVTGYLPAGRYTLSANNPSHNSLPNYVAIIQVFSADTLNSIVAEDNKSNSTDTKTIKAGNYEFRVRYQAGVTYNNFIIKPQLEIGEVATEYEPATPQTLYVPYTLRGIPVTSGGNYTDASGQQWVCDEIDFVRGVRVQRIGDVDMGTLSWHHQTFSNDRHIFTTASLDISNAKSGTIPVNAMCELYRATTQSAQWVHGDMAYYGTVGKTFSVVNNNYTDVASFKAAMSGVRLLYELETPIETDLSAEELAQYAAMHTNYPNTTIYADDNAGLSVDYKADTKLYIDKKFAEITEAIVNN